MRKFMFPVVLLAASLLGCGALSGQNSAEPSQAAAVGGGPNDFNPWMTDHLPNTRQLSAEGEQMLGHMGGSAQSIEGEAKHRKNWRDEIYPVVFGDKKAPNEILVILDFSDSQSSNVWNAVVEASKSLSPQNCKIAVFGRNSEPYGTDLMGLAIWIAHSRRGQAMPYLTYALKRWNEVKAAQNSLGTVKKFVNEYDAVAARTDFPIAYAYYSRLKPPVPANQELSLGRYCYDAGNVNMYQANQICAYYGVKKIPAVIVNGRPLSKISASAIIDALK